MTHPLANLRNVAARVLKFPDMDSMESLQRLVLDTIERDGSIFNTDALPCSEDGKRIDQQLLIGVLKRLVSHEMIEYDTIETEKWVLTKEGHDIAANGSHEVKVFAMIPKGNVGILVDEITKALGENGKIGQSKAFKNRWIGQKDSNAVIRLVDAVVDQPQLDLRHVEKTGDHENAETIKELKRRKLVERQKHQSYKVRKGIAFSLNLTKLATDLTTEMIQSGTWRDEPFKQYNFAASGLSTQGGHLHPLLKVREEFRKIFFEMGFTEMPTNQYVESSFWNFDTLFQPQQHPSRDAHDTFFLKDPMTCNKIPREYLLATKQMHENGGYGSTGHHCTWSEEEARKNILRTHTTAISSRMLYRLAQEPEFKPAKYFSIDKVFRNETVDATHLAEFHQIEGVVADYNLTLGDLIGMLNGFFHKLGMTRLRFKPAFNPYTEPSMEIFAYHEGLARWIEVGNSGIFRPEMLRPMGFDERVTVIAWGLSLERPTMIKYKVQNIRDLVGHKVDLAMVQANPICRLEK